MPFKLIEALSTKTNPNEIPLTLRVGHHFGVVRYFDNTINSGDDSVALATKRIRQRIDMDAWGTMEKFEVFDVEAKGDSVFQATHTFENLIGKEMKITRIYTLNAGLDSVIEK